MKHSNTRRLFAGLDRASKTHMVCVGDAGTIAIRLEIPNTGRSFTGLVNEVAAPLE